MMRLRPLARAFSAAAALPSPAAPHAYIRLTYVFSCATAAELPALRAPHRAAHLAHVAASSTLALGGALALDPPESMLIFKGSDAAAVDAFARADPYVTSGIVSRFAIAPWTVVAGAAL